MDIFDARSVSPMLFHQRVKPFDDPAFVFEIKLDGIRCIAYLDSHGTELRNKSNNSLNSRFPELSEIHRYTKDRCILDGELFILRDGRPNFEAIQRRIMLSNSWRIADAARKEPAAFVAFDILYCKDRAVMNLPLLGRKDILRKAVGSDTVRLAVSEFIEGQGRRIFDFAKQNGLEGIVAKKADSLYYPGKSTKNWLKIKNTFEEQFVICGYLHKADGMISIIVAKRHPNGLEYRGHVTLGVRGAAFGRIRSMPTLNAPPLPVSHGNEKVIWIEPLLSCTVEYLELSESGSMRHAVLKNVH